MSDSLSDETISAWLDDQLSPAEREQFETHLKDNPHDAERVQEFEQVRDQLRAGPRYELDKGFPERVLEAIRQRSSESESAPVSAASAVKPRRRAASTLPAALNWQAAVIAQTREPRRVPGSRRVPARRRGDPR